MADNVVTTPPKVVTIEKVAQGQLFMEKNPQLSSDLNANGFSIRGAEDISCKTINGIEPSEIAPTAVSMATLEAEKRFATREHSHRDLEEKILAAAKSLIESNLPGTPSAPLDHSHSIQSLDGTLPLSRLEHGEDIVRDLSDVIRMLKDMQSKNIDGEFSTLWSGVQKVSDRLNEQAAALESTKKELIGVIDGLRTKILSTPISNVEEKLEEVEIMGVRFALVPKKADSMIVREITGFDDAGKMVDAYAKRGTETLKVGDVVRKNDFLSLSPGCIVRILVS